MLVILSKTHCHTASTMLLAACRTIGALSRPLVLLSALLFSSLTFAQRGVFLSVDSFVAETFVTAPQVQTLWLNSEQKQVATDILNRNPGLRTRYYRQAGKTAWVLEEIGKELPITVGVVVEQGKVQNLVVLEYREVRGGEVRYRSFTEQFFNISLESDTQALDKRIDGISGATLSVRALQKIARLALYFHQQVVKPEDPLA